MLWTIYRDDDPLYPVCMSAANLDILLASLRKKFPAYIWDAEAVEADADGEPLETDGDGA